MGTANQFQRWLEKQRKTLADIYDRDRCGEWSGYKAGSIAQDASRRAADLRLPELMRVWPDDMPVPDADRYLVECLSAIPRQESSVLTPAEIAEEIGVSPDTVRAWIRSKQLLASNVANPGKRPRWVIKREDLDKFLRKRQPEALVKPNRRIVGGSFKKYRP